VGGGADLGDRRAELLKGVVSVPGTYFDFDVVNSVNLAAYYASCSTRVILLLLFQCPPADSL